MRARRRVRRPPVAPCRRHVVPGCLVATLARGTRARRAVANCRCRCGFPWRDRAALRPPCGRSHGAAPPSSRVWASHGNIAERRIDESPVTPVPTGSIRGLVGPRWGARGVDMRAAAVCSCLLPRRAQEVSVDARLCRKFDRGGVASLCSPWVGVALPMCARRLFRNGVARSSAARCVGRRGGDARLALCSWRCPVVESAPEFSYRMKAPRPKCAPRRWHASLALGGSA